MSQPHNSKPGGSYKVDPPNLDPPEDRRTMMSNQPPTRSSSLTQYQHNRVPQQNRGYGKENHPSAYCHQAQPIQAARVLQMGPAVLQNSMVSNVHHGSRPLTTRGVASHISGHPIHSPAPASYGSNAPTPLAPRFTVPVLSYQSHPSSQPQALSSVSASGTQRLHEISSVLYSTGQQTGVNGLLLAGSAGYPARTYARVGPDSIRDMADHRKPTYTHSFYISPSYSDAVRPGNFRANRTPQDPSQPYFPTPCPPPSPELQHPVWPQTHIPSTILNPSSYMSYPPGIIPINGLQVRNEVTQFASRLQSPSTSAASEAPAQSRHSTRSDDDYNGATVIVRSDARFLRDESDSDKTSTRKTAPYRNTSSSNSQKREGSILTPTQARNDASVFTQQDSKDYVSQSNELQGPILYDSRRGDIVSHDQILSQHDLARGPPSFSQKQGSNSDSHRGSNIGRLGSHASHRHSFRRNSVTRSPSSDNERVELRKTSSLLRASSLNEHAVPFIPGQHTYDAVFLTSHSVSSEVTESIASNDESHVLDENFDVYVEWFLDAFLNLDRLKDGIILREPISFEDIVGHPRGFVPKGVLPVLIPFEVTRSVEGCINWLQFQGNNPSAIRYLSRYLAVSLYTVNSQLQGYESEHYYHFLSILTEGLPDSNIRKRFCAALFSASVDIVNKIVKADIPPGATGSKFSLVLDIGVAQTLIIGTIFRLGFVSTASIMEFFWSLLEDRPHQARIIIIFELINAVGESICNPSNARPFGDFLTTLRRKYVVPPPGGSFPDVFLAPKERKQFIFNTVRSLLQEIRKLNSQWRLPDESRKEVKKEIHYSALFKNKDMYGYMN